MIKLKKFYVYLFFFGGGMLLSALPSQALVELRATYSLNVINPEAVTSQFPAFTDLSGFGADAILTLPIFPIGFGLRYETLGSSKGATIGAVTSTLKTNLSRFALLANFRFIDTGIYLGLIGSYGITDNAKYTLTSNAINTGELKTNAFSTYSFGAEGGVHIMGFLVGGEAGYLFGKAKSFEDSNGTIQLINGNNIEVDYGGLYLKLHGGYTF